MEISNVEYESSKGSLRIMNVRLQLIQDRPENQLIAFVCGDVCKFSERAQDIELISYSTIHNDILISYMDELESCTAQFSNVKENGWNLFKYTILGFREEHPFRLVRADIQSSYGSWINVDPTTVPNISETTWSVLAQFSKVTKFCKDVASSIIEGDGFDRYNRTVKSLIVEKGEEGFSKIVYEYEARPAIFEREEWTYRPKDKTPLTSHILTSFYDQEGRISVSDNLTEIIFFNGVDPASRPLIWKYLLRYYTWDSTFDERSNADSIFKQEYESLKLEWLGLIRDEFNAEKKPREAISNSKTQRKSVDASENLKDYLMENSHRIEKDVSRTDRSVTFEGLTSVGESIGFHLDMMENTQEMHILRDILLSYSLYNRKLGYVQGMSDLAATILYVVKDESESFWCFVRLMESMQSNFHHNQIGMQTHLTKIDRLVKELDPPLYSNLVKKHSTHFFFCFRWFLILFKREFQINDIVYLWEVLWCKDREFQYYVVMAIIEIHRKVITEELESFDDILKYINDLSYQIQVEPVLKLAQGIFEYHKSIKK